MTDPAVRFWQNEFASWKPQFQAEAVAPVLNKIGQFVSSPILRNIIGQTSKTLDLRRVLDSGQVLIVNLSKGRLGEDASQLLGSLLVTGIQLAAMSRADTPEEERREFFLFIDEFQNFSTEAFPTILSEARKYRLGLTISNQYLAQVDEETTNAVFGNVGSLLCFQVGAGDSEVLAEQLGGDLRPQDVFNLPQYAAYARLLIDGLSSRPFSMQTLPPMHIASDPHRLAIVRRASQRRFARPIRVVQSEVEREFTAA